jgi:ribosomal protein S21
MINVEVVKNANETTTSLIRRFSKRVQGSGILPRMRSLRYAKRPATKFVRKKIALKRISRQGARLVLEKLGKALPEKRRRR